MSGLQNVRYSKRPVAKNIHIYSVLVVGGNLQVLLQPCLQAVVDWRLRLSDGRVSFSILEVVNIAKRWVSQKGTICGNGCV